MKIIQRRAIKIVQSLAGLSYEQRQSDVDTELRAYHTSVRPMLPPAPHPRWQTTGWRGAGGEQEERLMVEGRESKAFAALIPNPTENGGK